MQRAKELKIKVHVEDQLKEVEKKIKEEQEPTRPRQFLDGLTAFEPDETGKSYTNMVCLHWIATENGIESLESSRTNQVACRHPILPVKRMRNLETGEEQITLAFKRGGRNRIWNELTVPKEIVVNSRQITALAKYGVAVTSESSKLLVRYLSDIEADNEDWIPVIRSSSKLGWHDKSFLPYDTDVTFDASMKFPQLFNAIKERGSRETWLDHIRKIRKDPYIEPKIVLAASFASPLLHFLNIATFIVDSNGVTEAGKTVENMVATSVWACPDEGQYMSDFMTTDAELEVRCDMLNHLPLILDDSAKMKKNIRDNIENVIYNLCSGSGKKRSNKELGSERVRTWRNVIIVNGEQPLSGFVSNAGAINRIIEINLEGEQLFESPSYTADLVRSNYGFAGHEFIMRLKEADPEEIRKLHANFARQLKNRNNMAKQILSMAALLTADKLATDWIFQDGNNLTADDVSKYLTDKNDVSEGARCYQYLIGLLDVKGQHFDLQFGNVDQWGEVEYKDGIKYINFFVLALEQLVKDAGYSRKVFTSWARNKGLLRTNTSKGRDVYGVRNGNIQKRFISVKVVDLVDMEEKAEKEEKEREADEHMFD